MPIVAISIFGVSLVGLTTLFAFKYWERERSIIYFALQRKKLDRYARVTKLIMRALNEYAQELPGHAVVLARQGVHLGAVSFAQFARSAEKRAHQIADLVSHKRGFERRETHSTFLKKVAEHKSTLNGNGDEQFTDRQ